MKAMLIDTTKCIGCRACQVACKSWNNLPGESTRFSETWSNPRYLDADNYTRIIFREVATPEGDLRWHFISRRCMHCLTPACASACPVGALKKLPDGPVVYNDDTCIGCRYCMLACPYQVPRYQWTKLAPYVKKCDLCSERVTTGGQPACTEACPVQASVFGDRDQLIADAWERIRSDSRYVPQIYGLQEAGGGSVLFVSDVEFEKLGFKPLPTGNQPLPTLTASALGDSPKVVIMGGTILSALYWITQRRREVALAESAGKSGVNQSNEERN